MALENGPAIKDFTIRGSTVLIEWGEGVPEIKVCRLMLCTIVLSSGCYCSALVSDLFFTSYLFNGSFLNDK